MYENISKYTSHCDASNIFILWRKTKWELNVSPVFRCFQELRAEQSQLEIVLRESSTISSFWISDLENGFFVLSGKLRKSLGSYRLGRYIFLGTAFICSCRLFPDQVYFKNKTKTGWRLWSVDPLWHNVPFDCGVTGIRAAQDQMHMQFHVFLCMCIYITFTCINCGNH